MSAVLPALVLPTLNPTEKILEVVDNAVSAGFDDIIIVNDGSKSECDSIFDRLAQNPHCTILKHEVNRGKGAGLKTAFAHFLSGKAFAESPGVVTIDDDGQHSTEDIKHCAEMMLETGRMILGVRDFDSDNVPPKSRFGNKLTAVVLRLSTGLAISDTQTGLRAIPREFLKVFSDTEGDRFEYETNMLLDVKRHALPIGECVISTIYHDNNSGTHFRPIVDSFKIYSRILKYAAGSIFSFIIDIALFNILMLCLPALFSITLGRVTLASTCIARVFSSAFNFLYNRGVVFKHSDGTKGNLAKSAVKYYALCICQMLLSAFIVSGVLRIIGGESAVAVAPWFATLVKIVVDCILFFAGYHIQKHWVYK